jgi:hypothetical protein
MAVVDHRQVIRAEAVLEPLDESLPAAIGHGSTLMNGRTSYDSKTPAVT